MPRQARPFLHRGWYITEVGGTRRKLCREEDGLPKAQELLDRLKVERHDGGGRLPPELTVAEAAALFLREVETDKGPDHRTFTFYQRNLQRLIARVGNRRLRTITQQDATAYKGWLKSDARTKPTGRRRGQKLGKVRTPTGLGPTSVNHHLRSAKRLFNWCILHEPPLLHRSPFRGVKLEEEHGRERVITDEEFSALLAACSSDEQRDFLRVTRQTAARPEDIRRLTWAMIDWDAHCWVFTKHKTATTQRQKKPRFVTMIEAVEALLRQRRERLGNPPKIAHVFTNEDGRPWDADDLSQWFRRLRERAGIAAKDGENIVLYSHRHTRLTELAGSMNPHLLQKLAGHTTFTTTLRYLHVPGQEVREAAEEADRKRQPPEPK